MLITASGSHAQTSYIYQRYYKVYAKKDTVYFVSDPKKVSADAKAIAKAYKLANFRYKLHARIPAKK